MLLCAVCGGNCTTYFGDLMRTTQYAGSTVRLGSKTSRAKFHRTLLLTFVVKADDVFHLKNFFSLTKNKSTGHFKDFWCHEIITFEFFLIGCAKQNEWDIDPLFHYALVGRALGGTWKVERPIRQWKLIEIGKETIWANIPPSALQRHIGFVSRQNHSWLWSKITNFVTHGQSTTIIWLKCPQCKKDLLRIWGAVHKRLRNESLKNNFSWTD